MNRLFVFLLVALIGFGTYVYFLENGEAPAAEPQPAGGRVMDVQTYVRNNIATLSPEPPVLGGTFYVTEIDTANGHGTVWYEDGHMAHVADFEYVVDEYGITISMFELRGEE
jgi:hypothetical protein